jgi:predicted PurR-regulated permease PerM
LYNRKYRKAKGGAEMKDKEFKKFPFFKVFLLAVGILLAVKFIFDFHGFWSLFSSIGGTVVSVLSYVLVGFIIAYILDAYIHFWSDKVLKKWECKTKAKRNLCIVIAYLTFAGVLSFFILTLLPSLIDSVKMLAKEIPNLIDQSQNLYGKFQDGTLINLPDNVINAVEKAITDFFGTIVSKIEFSKIPGFVIKTVAVIFNIVMGIMVSVYMLIEKSDILRAGNKIVDTMFAPKKARRAKWAVKKVNEIFKRYFTGKILQACVISVLAFIIFSLLRLPYAMLFAVVIGVFNTIPYIGPWVGAAPVILICLVQDFWSGVAAAAAIIVIQVLDNWIISPRVIGDQMGISPLSILIGLCIGGKLFGVPGMILGDVMAALVKVFFYDTYVEAIRRRKLRERAEEKKKAESLSADIWPRLELDLDEDLFGGTPQDEVAVESVMERERLFAEKHVPVKKDGKTRKAKVKINKNDEE